MFSVFLLSRCVLLCFVVFVCLSCVQLSQTRLLLLEIKTILEAFYLERGLNEIE